MSIQSSFSKILFAFKHHLSKGLPLVLGQCSNSGEGVPHWVCFQGFFFLLPLSVFVMTLNYYQIVACTRVRYWANYQ